MTLAANSAVDVIVQKRATEMVALILIAPVSSTRPQFKARRPVRESLPLVAMRAYALDGYGCRMIAADYLLLTCCFAAFAIAGWCGARFRSLPLWAYADVVYYPLGAIGVLMLFLSNDTNRVALRLEAILHEVEAVDPFRPPTRELRPATLEQETQTYAAIRREQDLAETCRDIPDPFCGPSREHGSLLQTSFPELGPPNRDATILARAEWQILFCRGSRQLFTGLLESEGLASDTYPLVQVHLHTVRSAGDIERQSGNLTAALDLERRKAIAIQPIENREFVATYLTSEHRFARSVFQALAFCAVQSADLEPVFKQWTEYESKQQERTARLEEMRSQVREAWRVNPKGTLQARVKAFSSQTWPWFVISALALKFGKAVTSLPRRRTHGAIKLGRRGS